jgi:hypothetical protein
MNESQMPTLKELQQKQDEKLLIVQNVKNSFDDYEDKDAYKKDLKEAWDKFTEAFTKRAGFEIAEKMILKILG